MRDGSTVSQTLRPRDDVINRLAPEYAERGGHHLIEIATTQRRRRDEGDSCTFMDQFTGDAARRSEDLHRELPRIDDIEMF